jgi:restriction system protein
MWMVRGEGGSLYDIFRERAIVAIGWSEIAGLVQPGMTKKEILAVYLSRRPDLKRASAISGAAQVWRFMNEMKEGDGVTTYSPHNRTYLVGKILGPATYNAGTVDQGISLSRPVQWSEAEVERDRLGPRSKNSLGSTLTVFVVPDATEHELWTTAQSSSPLPSIDSLRTQRTKTEEVEDYDDGADTSGVPAVRDPLEDLQSIALERIKDTVVKLGWEDMQELVAGILRAMGYKTQVSLPGPDRGKDIVASPDGFGFEHPRIVVEVKHRTGQMDSKAIRSFLGGRHKDDRGLYVSTGGFSKDAHYEADRAAVPLTLWTLDTLVRVLVEHYDTTDAETKRLVPLKRLYIPA